MDYAKRKRIVKGRREEEKGRGDEKAEISFNERKAVRNGCPYYR